MAASSIRDCLTCGQVVLQLGGMHAYAAAQATTPPLSSHNIIQSTLDSL
jgi:hypothetical protein